MQHELYIANRIKVRTLFKFDFPGNRYTLLQNQKNWPSQFPNDADRMPPTYSQSRFASVPVFLLRSS